MVPKMVGVGGRYVDDRVYARTMVDADLFQVFKTLAPQKLFRRSFLDERGIRFPEERVRLEDGMFISRAYLEASRVSMLADYDYYFIRTRPDGGNISATLGDPKAYIGSVATLMDIMRERSPDPELAEAIALDVYRRKGLKHFRPERFFNHRPKRLDAWFTAVQEVAFTLPNAISYVQAAVNAGLDIDKFAGQLSFFFNSHNNLFEEVGKFRAARRIWAHIMRERFHAQDPRSMHVFRERA